MLKRKESAIKKDDLLEMAAEQFARLFWKQIINRDRLGIDRHVELKRLSQRAIPITKKKEEFNNMPVGHNIHKYKKYTLK